MLWELETNRLEVFLTPAPDQAHVGHMVRTVETRNIEWYRELCSRFSANRNSLKGSGKKHDTKVKRQRITELLRRLANGEKFDSKYKEFLIEKAKDMKAMFEYEMKHG